MLSKRLKDILNEKNISIELYSQMSGVPMETLRNIYYGRTSNPNIKTVMAMAEALDMTINDFLGVESSTGKEEKLLLAHFRKCGKHGKSVIMNVARFEASTVREHRDGSGLHHIPCITAVGDVFHGMLYEPDNAVSIETEVKEAYMGFKTTVNDGAPTYCKGDIILLANRFPRTGEHALFYKDQKAFIRIYLEEKGSYRLKCIHKIGEDMVLRRMENVECLGTCCGLIKA